MVLWRVYYAAVRTLGRPYALTKYAEKKLSSSCPEKVLPSDKNVENAQRALFEHKHNGLLKLYLSARNINKRRDCNFVFKNRTYVNCISK